MHELGREGVISSPQLTEEEEGGLLENADGTGNHPRGQREFQHCLLSDSTA